MAMKNPNRDTSWGKVSQWYDTYLESDDSYQMQVILPNLTRVLALKADERVLDLACGQGFFTREFAKTGAAVQGADIAPELIKEAKKHDTGIRYDVASAEALSFAADASFDTVVCVLALQNMENLPTICKEVNRVLKSGGRFVMVLNHPAFRVLKRSKWGWDEAGVQYRRIDGYLSAAKIFIDMHPGKDAAKNVQTISYHRSLQDFFKSLTGAGLAVTRLEEWISHRVSEKGPKQKAEDTARKEIPLFMMLEARKR
jgi:ubiquinone/menaquinone biosynthesis C-methylase UbiE